MSEKEAKEKLYALATNNGNGKYKGSYEEAFDILTNLINKQETTLERIKEYCIEEKEDTASGSEVAEDILKMI